MTTTRDDFLPSVKTTLAGRVGWKCSFPGCPRSTAGPSSESPDKWIKNGIAAHITAAAPGGPRYDLTLTPQQRSDISNAIWMCPTHGSLIDKDKTAYTATDIRQWKEAAENRAQREMEHPSNPNPSQLLEPLYSPKDIRILGDYGKVLSYRIIQLIKNEPFGSFVKDEVTNPLYEILIMEDDPKFQFQNGNLEKLRCELSAKVRTFFMHFKQQSAGLPNGYEYINVSELTRRDPSSRDHWEQQIYKTQDLANDVCSTALELLKIKEKN